MRAAEQVQLAPLRHLFYLVGYGRIVGHSQVDRLPTFCSAIPTRSIVVSMSTTLPKWTPSRSRST
jgi:hypothetical protein